MKSIKPFIIGLIIALTAIQPIQAHMLTTNTLGNSIGAIVAGFTAYKCLQFTKDTFDPKTDHLSLYADWKLIKNAYASKDQDRIRMIVDDFSLDIGMGTTIGIFTGVIGSTLGVLALSFAHSMVSSLLN